MKIKQIVELLNGEVITGKDFLDSEVLSACSADMMSDVLAFVKNQAVLITGLCNPQVIRTANMMDMKCVVFVRGKKPDELMTKLAEENNIVIITSPYRMFPASGILYGAGLKSEL